MKNKYGFLNFQLPDVDFDIGSLLKDGLLQSAAYGENCENQKIRRIHLFPVIRWTQYEHAALHIISNGRLMSDEFHYLWRYPA
mgnify:FL=1